jgi:hypothetical protein
VPVFAESHAAASTVAVRVDAMFGVFALAIATAVLDPVAGDECCCTTIPPSTYAYAHR